LAHIGRAVDIRLDLTGLDVLEQTLEADLGGSLDDVYLDAGEFLRERIADLRRQRLIELRCIPSQLALFLACVVERLFLVGLCCGARNGRGDKPEHRRPEPEAWPNSAH